MFECLMLSATHIRMVCSMYLLWIHVIKADGLDTGLCLVVGVLVVKTKWPSWYGMVRIFNKPMNS